jgi:hypothetical protein
VPDINAQGSPLWWVQKLEGKLEARRSELKRLDNYYEGNHPLGFATPKFREAFGTLFEQFADNWCDLVVDAVEERLNVQGFRLGEQKGDAEAWRIWQANQLDADSRVAHTEALIHGVAYASVWARDDDETTPNITIEHPTQMIVAHAAGNPRNRLAALKRFTDDDGYQRATLYLPDAIHRFRSSTSIDTKLIIVGDPWNGSRWVEFSGDGDSVIDNPLGVVPVVPLVNRRRLLNEGVSEIARVIPIQQGINKLVADMIVASEFGAAPQRWATGIEVPRDPKTGEPLPVFENLLSRLMASERNDTNFGQFSQTDLKPFVTGIEMLVQHVASQSRTPPHYFYLSGQFPSGESIKSAETGLVAKTVRKQGPFGESWEEVQRLGFMVIGDDARANAVGMETIWGDPESRSESEHVDAVLKKQALGIDDEILWEELGMSPQQIERNKALKAAAAQGPVASSPEEMSFDERVQSLSRYVQAGFDPESAAQVLGLPSVKHLGVLPVTVQKKEGSGGGAIPPSVPPVPAQ